MSEVLSQEELRVRADSLGVLNGMELVFVELDTAAVPPVARLTVEFFNDNGLADIVSRFANDGEPATALFRIRGGRRRRGGELPGAVQVETVAMAAGPTPGLMLEVRPIGDYSTYRLTALDAVMDPVFRELSFKFRPGCFNINCRKVGQTEAPPTAPAIDYLARDYHSFKHLLIASTMKRVPDWQPSSEADLDSVVINLLAARGDELADKQDRVANEAYFGRARKRVSLARHARLVDYHIHQGNQATTWLALEVSADIALPVTFAAWTGDDPTAPTAQIFEAVGGADMIAALSTIRLYSWDGLVGALDQGATAADLALPAGLNPSVEGDAIDFADLLMNRPDSRLLIEEHLNPETGRAPGRDRRQRQIVRLIGAERRFDPLANAWMVRVSWRVEDALRSRFCFVTRCPDEPPQEDVSLFHGNLIRLAHGRLHLTLFTDPNRKMTPTLAAALDTERSQFRVDSPWGVVTKDAHYRETPWGRICELPEGPLAYRATPPGGEVPPESTLDVRVEGIADAWSERIDPIESQADDNDFIVETAETGLSAIRFGRAPNGEAPPAGAYVSARYQVGRGTDGNIGADQLTGFDRSLFAGVERVWNPFDATNGRQPETPAIIRRRAPEAFRSRQLRAVTLTDYRRRAEELPFVQRAAAHRDWTGSWSTVRVSVDPLGATTLASAQLQELADYLNAVRLIGEDIEIRPPDFVPLDIRLVVCARTGIWPEDLEFELEEAFSEGWTADGRQGFFHPDLWTFGQAIHASQIVGRAMEVSGIDRVLEVGMRRWDQAGGPSTTVVTLRPEDLPAATDRVIKVAPSQIIRVANDPDALENGRLEVDVQGGRQ
jgi:hypothetical protein